MQDKFYFWTNLFGIEKVRGGGGGKGCAVVRASASHQYGLGSNPAVNAIYCVSLLLVLALAKRGFSLGISGFFFSSRTNSFKVQLDRE